MWDKGGRQEEKGAVLCAEALPRSWLLWHSVPGKSLAFNDYNKEEYEWLLVTAQ